jgi:hypothetical protein
MSKNLMNSLDDLRAAVEEAHANNKPANAPRKNRHERRRDNVIARRKGHGKGR